MVAEQEREIAAEGEQDPERAQGAEVDSTPRLGQKAPASLPGAGYPALRRLPGRDPHPLDRCSLAPPLAAFGRSAFRFQDAPSWLSLSRASKVKARDAIPRIGNGGALSEQIPQLIHPFHQAVPGVSEASAVCQSIRVTAGGRGGRRARSGRPMGASGRCLRGASDAPNLRACAKPGLGPRGLRRPAVHPAG